MAEPSPTERLRLSPRSTVVAVALFGLTLGILRLVMASQRVLGWMIAAAAIAGLLEPAVRRLARRMPRGAAVAVVAVVTLGAVGFVVYKTVDEIVDQTDVLQEAAPRRARSLESSPRFGDFAREVDLADRTARFVEDVPSRLRGGTPAEAIRSATTRGLSYLATAILAIFFLLHGPRIAAAASAQVRDAGRRKRLERVAGAAFQRGFGYARGTLGMSVAAGLLTYALARATDVPGAAPLALWVALWDVVPLVGAFIGGVPIIILAGVESTATAFLIAASFIGYQIFETVVLQRPLHKRTVKVGPFLTVVSGMAGLELYGVGGALLMMLLAGVAVAVGDELAPESGPEEAEA